MLKKVLVIVPSQKGKNEIISITENKQKEEHTNQKLVSCWEFLLLLCLQNPIYSGEFLVECLNLLVTPSRERYIWKTFNNRETTHLSWCFKCSVSQWALCIQILMSEQKTVKGNETLCWRRDILMQRSSKSCEVLTVCSWVAHMT